MLTTERSIARILEQQRVQALFETWKGDSLKLNKFIRGMSVLKKTFFILCDKQQMNYEWH